MKRVLSILLSVLFISFGIASAKEITINFEWDPNTEVDMAGYTLYKRTEGQTYNYEIPDDIVPCVMTEGNCIPTKGSIVWEAPDGVLTVYHFVARAYDTADAFSEDSDEISKTIDLRSLLAPTNFAGVWNEVTENVDLTWEQEQSDRIIKWIVVYGASDGGPYPESYEVEYTGQETYIAEIPIIAPPNQVTIKYFIVQGIAEYDIVSPMTDQIIITIDKNEPPSKVINFHIPVVE